MASQSLHPLARQSIAAANNSDCFGWAFGMTKYLAHHDSKACVQWAFDIIRPYLSDSATNGIVVTQSIRVLCNMLENPRAADLRQVEDFACESWNHRDATRGGGPLARLLWAMMGVVELATP